MNKVIYGVQDRQGKYPDLYQFEAFIIAKDGDKITTTLWKNPISKSKYLDTGVPYRNHYLWTSEEKANLCFNFMENDPEYVRGKPLPTIPIEF